MIMQMNSGVSFRMLKVIIVDDERIQREGIMKHVSWQDYDMQVVGCAADGVEALELAETCRPDILITDVKMPRMNGIELAQKIKELLPNIIILIISGYEEFEYARAAIDLNAHAFILKPINMGKLRQCLEKINLLNQSEQCLQQEIAEMKQRLEESKPVLRDSFLKDLACGFLKDENVIRRRAEYLAVPLPEKDYYVIVVQVDNPLEDTNEEKNQLFYLNLSKSIHESYSRCCKGISVRVKDNEFVIVLFGQDVKDIDSYGIVQNIKEEIERKSNYTITIGVSEPINNIIYINEGYRQAELAVRQKYYLGRGKVIFFNDIKAGESAPGSLDEKYEGLMEKITLGDNNMVGQTVDDIFALFARTSVQEQYVKAFCFRLMSDIYRIVYEMNEKMEDIFGEEDIVWSKIYRFDTIPDVRMWVKNIITAVSNYIYNKRSRKNSNVVDTIIKILEDRYYEQITIEELAGKVYLTPNYICNLFKENIGESIIDYLTKVRMRHAQRLLADPGIKIYEVAEKTGFNSTSYFSIVFKNSFGISPKEYRDSLQHVN